MQSVHKTAFLAGEAFCALMSASVAFAAPEPENTSGKLETVVVTAQHRSEDMQIVPVSVDVLQGADLSTFTASGQDTLLALSGKVPGLYVESSTGRIFPRFYIRGLGNVDYYLGASQPVSVVVDDIVEEHVVLKSTPLFDVGDIEVLRGPQGSLFGRNTTAGTIKVSSKRPTMYYTGDATASYGRYGSVNLEGGIGGPLIAGKLAFRLSGLYQHRNDYIDNDFDGASDDGTKTPEKNAMGGFDERDLRLQFLLTPTSDFFLLISGHWRWYDGTATVFIRNALTKGSNSTSGISRTSVRYDEGQDNPQGYDTYGGSVNATWDLGSVTLTSITGYESTSGFSRGETDGGAAADYDNSGYGESRGNVRALSQWSEEFRVANSDNAARFRWQGGVFLFDSRDNTEFFQRAYFLDEDNTSYNPNNWVLLHDVNTSWAIFGQASYDILSDLAITAGARITRDKKETHLLKTANTAADVVTYTGRTDVKLSDSKPSYDLSVQYEFTPNLSIYARVAYGFRGPTIQGRSAVFNSDFTTANSETILSWEAGVKSRPTDRLRLNADVFTYTVYDIQLNATDENGNGMLLNANKATAYGLETSFDWLPLDNLSINGGLSLLHTEIQDKDLTVQTCAYSGKQPCTVLNSYTQITQYGSPAFLAKVDGNPLPNAPEYNISLSARYDIPVTDTGRAFVSTDWNIQGYTNLTLYRTKEFTSNGNLECGLKLGYTGGNGAWEAAFYVRNLTNEKNLTGVIENYMAAVISDPRIYGVSLRTKF